MVVGHAVDPWRGLGQWGDAVAGLHGRIAHRFARSEVRERIRRYLLGLLGRVERKNGWQLAEAIEETNPQGVQRLLNAAKWDALPTSKPTQKYLLTVLLPPSFVLVSSRRPQNPLQPSP